jgi:hypothetical protein
MSLIRTENETLIYRGREKKNTVTLGKWKNIVMMGKYRGKEAHVLEN